MDKIRVAFIGCGNMSSQLQRCIPLVPEFEFVATCDLVEEKAQIKCAQVRRTPLLYRLQRDVQA